MFDELEKDRCVSGIGEAAVTRAILKENPTFKQNHPLSSRGVWFFENSSPEKILAARLAFFRNDPVPCKDVVDSLRELKYSVRLKLEGPR